MSIYEFLSWQVFYTEADFLYNIISDKFTTFYENAVNSTQVMRPSVPTNYSGHR